MKRLLMAGFLLQLELPATDPVVTLRLRVYDLAATTESALTETSRILADAGIAVEWEDGSPDSTEARRLDASVPITASQRFVPINGALNARILPHPPSVHKTQTLGFSLPFAKQGVHVTLYWTSIEELARTNKLSPSLLLGAVMAHEIGHVLLGSGLHSLSGIMRERWGTSEYHSISLGQLQFTPEEAARMRASIRKSQLPYRK